MSKSKNDKLKKKINKNDKGNGYKIVRNNVKFKIEVFWGEFFRRRVQGSKF
jgi:hypothetical protein